MRKGDILLITFPFTDLSGDKLRPAIVLATTSLDLTVCFITSQINFTEQFDIFLKSSQLNGLKKDSIARASKIATLDRNLAKGLLGKLSQIDITELNTQLKLLLPINLSARPIGWVWHYWGMTLEFHLQQPGIFVRA